jgi:hypothetical protein
MTFHAGGIIASVAAGYTLAPSSHAARRSRCVGRYYSEQKSSIPYDHTRCSALRWRALSQHASRTPPVTNALVQVVDSRSHDDVREVVGIQAEKYDGAAAADLVNRKPLVAILRLLQVRVENRLVSATTTVSHTLAQGSLRSSLFDEHRSVVTQIASTLGVFTTRFVALERFGGQEGTSARATEVAVELRAAVVQLGPSFVKLAQSASTRKDLIRDEIVDVLSGA